MTPEEYSGLLIASNNQGKIREIEALLSDLEVNLLTPRALGITLSVAETGDTYYQNALIKARAYAVSYTHLTLPTTPYV
jgi:XTP/dITP diphosphohydrolase